MMNMKKRVMSGVLGAALALTGFAGITAPAMAVVGNGYTSMQQRISLGLTHTTQQGTTDTHELKSDVS